MVSLSMGNALMMADMINFRPGILFTARNGFRTRNARKLLNEMPTDEPSESSMEK